jgi:aspartate beta-hydroxylase
VAGQTVSLQEGRAVLFDDSFLHEAANSSASEPRVVLIVDVWHPDLSDEEVGGMFILTISAFLRCSQ